MAKSSFDKLYAVADLIKEKSTQTNRAASTAINKTATFAIKETIEAMMGEVTLEESYIKKHLRTVARASPANLRAVIQANERETNLTRYKYSQSKAGVSVAVNRGQFRTIKKAFYVTNLRNSGTSGIALRNRDAVEYFTRALRKGYGATAKKRAKLARIRQKAANKPNGIEVLKSRSINQLMLSVREDIQPQIRQFLIDEFVKDFFK